MKGILRHRRPAPRVLVIALLCALSLTACGGSTLLGGSDESSAGYPEVATKNTTRVGGETTADRAAAVSLAVWPGAGQRPGSVALLPGDWQSALAATPLAAPPFNAAFLMANDGVPDSTESALDALNPTGVKASQGVKRIRIGSADDPGDSSQISADYPAALADAVDQSREAAGAHMTNSVVVVGTTDSQWSIPAGAWAARSGDPVLFAEKDALPQPTVAAIRRHGRPLILLLAPISSVSVAVEKQLQSNGDVVRITGKDPTDAAIAFARFRDGDRGWGLLDPGHGFIFYNQNNPMDGIISSPLSSAGTWAATIPLPSDSALPASLDQYLRDVQPGFRDDPTRSVYNHGWLMGNTDSISQQTQANIDRLLEMVPANERMNP
ncbi:MAG: hypothetical protein NTY57_07280 [Solirubrobacterales bacterium]|nr:hypothetical protein [Solirubrobacterales bacterium]